MGGAPSAALSEISVRCDVVSETLCAQDHYTALMRASLRGDPEMLQALLDAGADVEARRPALVGGGGGDVVMVMGWDSVVQRVHGGAAQDYVSATFCAGSLDSPRGTVAGGTTFRAWWRY